MSAEVLLILSSCLAIAWLLVCSWLWLLAMIRLSRNQSILNLVPRGPVPWDYVEIFACFLATVLGAFLARYCVVWSGIIPVTAKSMKDLTVDQRGTMLLVNGLVNLTAMLLTTVWIYWRARWQDSVRGSIRVNTSAFIPQGSMGLSRKVGLGFLAAIMLIPPTLLVQGLVTRIIPYRHDVLDLLRQGLTPYFLWCVFFSAVVVAPLWEEFFFRKLLQGWLESTDLQNPSQSSFRQANARPSELNTLDAPQNLNQPIVEADFTGSVQGQSVQGQSDGMPPIWPLCVSASIFALAHYGQGPAPIPLFFLAVGLGFLYRQTHSVIPCMVVHATLNCLSLTTAVLSVK